MAGGGQMGMPTSQGPIPWHNLFWWGGICGLLFAIGSLITYAFSLAAIPASSQPTIDTLNTLWLARTPATVIAWTHMVLYLLLLVFGGAIYRAVPHRYRRPLGIAVVTLAMNVLLVEAMSAIDLTLISPVAAAVAHDSNASMQWLVLALTLTAITNNLGNCMALLEVLMLIGAALGLHGITNLPCSFPKLTFALAALRALSIFANAWRPAHPLTFVVYLLIICWIALVSFWLLSLSDPWAQPIKVTGELPAVKPHSRAARTLRAFVEPVAGAGKSGDSG
jgi:hypothetical protein